MLKKIKDNNLDVLIVLVLAFIMIMMLPDLNSMFVNETKPKQEEPVKKQNFSLEIQERILYEIGNSYIYLDSYNEITDKEVLNKQYELKDNAIKHMDEIILEGNNYVVTIHALFKNGNKYYYDKDMTVYAGTLKSNYDFNSILFKEVEGLWKYVYTIDKDSYEVLSFKVIK